MKSCWGQATCAAFTPVNSSHAQEPEKHAAYGVGRVGTRHPRRVAGKLLKVTGAGTIRKQAAKRKNL